MTDRSGHQLGNYRLIRLLGHGGFADVYLGEHIYLQTQAAIKVLHAQLAPDTIGNFLAEAQTIAHLAHPHIIHILDFGVENAIPFLVMEYAPNGTLRQRHPRGTHVPMLLTVSYVRQIAGALQHAHDQKLIHRDVKPENMLLGYSNNVLLSDFGIATIAQTSRSLNTQDISGTIAYMSPEQVQGKPRPASDQYSLGIITYEWLTGYCPFQGSFAEIASQHMFAPLPSLRTLNQAIPPDVEQVLLMALAKNPDARFARVEAFANALEQACQAGLSTLPGASPIFIDPSSTAPTAVATPPAQVPASITPSNNEPTYIPVLALYQPSPGVAPSPPSITPPASLPETMSVPSEAGRSRRGISRRAVLGGLLGLAAVAGGAAALLAIEHFHSPAQPATATPQPTSTPTSTPVTTSTPVRNRPLIHSGPDKEYTLSWSPDGTKIASAGNGEVIEVWDPVTGNSLFNLLSGSSTVYSVAWSPDGMKIASGQKDGTVKIWDATNGNPVSNLTGHSGRVNSVAWSSDSRYIVSGSGDHTARVWDAFSGSQVLTYSLHTNEVLAVAWSHDNSRIASASDDNTVQIWDATNANRFVDYMGHSGFVVAMRWSPDGQYIASGGVDTTVQVWVATSGTLFYKYTGHSAEVESVAWSPDSRRVASAGDDKTVQVWQVP